MSMFKIRVGLLGVLALLLLGAFSAAPAFAEGGPYCHHREIGGKVDNGRIPETSPEEIAGAGGEQRLEVKILGVGLNIIATQGQVKGIIYNNPDQCQVKIAITYAEIQLSGFEKSCEVKVNGNNVVKLFGHQAWKWNGSPVQLLEKSQAAQHRDWIFLSGELQQGATELPAGNTAPFATITVTSKPGEKCSFPISQQPVEGSATAAGYANPQKSPENQSLEEWARVEELRATGGEGAQHFWNGEKFIGVQTKLKFGPEPAKYVGKLQVNTIGKQGKAPPQEIAYFES